MPRPLPLPKKWQKKETSPALSPTESLVASLVATKAAKPIPPLVPKGMKKKAQAIKPTKDLSQMTSTETLSSHPNSPLHKSPLSSPSKTMGSPSIATSRVAAFPTKQPDQPPSPIVTLSSPPKNPKPSSSKSKKKGKVVAFPRRYSSENAYSSYFFKFENEHLFKKYITRGFILERPMELDSFRVVGVQKIVEDRGWESTITYTPRFVTKVVNFMPTLVTT